jgi:hypothetical protein
LFATVIYLQHCDKIATVEVLLKYHTVVFR